MKINYKINYECYEVMNPDSRDGNGSVGHAWVNASDPLTHDDEITAQ